MMTAQYGDRLLDLEARIQELESRHDVLAGLLAIMEPVRRVLAHYDVPEAQHAAVYGLLDQMSAPQSEGGVSSFTEFQARVGKLLPERRDDRRFVELLVEALKVERPEARHLYEHFTTAMALFKA